MTISYKPAAADDAGLPADICNASFSAIVCDFGACPGQDRTIEMTEESIR